MSKLSTTPLKDLSPSEMKNISGGNWMVEVFNKAINEMKEMMWEAGVISNPYN